MTSWRPVRVVVVVAVVALAAYGLRAGLKPAAGAGGAAGPAAERAPRFVAMTVDPTPARKTLDDYAGQPLLVNIWATWCDPCRDEMPSLERLYQAFKTRGLRVVAISVDEPGNDPFIREFVQEKGLTFDILHDATSDVMTQFRARGVPQTFLVSRSGEIVATRFVADWAAPQNMALVDSLLLGPRAH